MEKAKELLLSTLEKHLLICSSKEWPEDFITKISISLTSCSIQTTIVNDLILKEIKQNGAIRYLLAFSPSLSTFLDLLKFNALQSTLLKKFTLTFIEEISSEEDETHLALFNRIYKDKGCTHQWDWQCLKEVTGIDLMGMSGSELVNYLNSAKKPQVFKVIKMALRKRLQWEKPSTSLKPQKRPEKKKDRKRKMKPFGANSLISISDEVKKFIQRCKRTTPLKTTNYIVDLLKRMKTRNPYHKRSILLKNVQRRVYDAINVMCALGIISKQKNVITVIENDALSRDTTVEQSINEMKLAIEAKQYKLNQAITELKVYQHFSRLNHLNASRGEAEEIIALPFNFINQHKQQSCSTTLKDYPSTSNVLSLNSPHLNELLDAYDDLMRRISRSIDVKKSQVTITDLSRTKCIEYCNILNGTETYTSPNEPKCHPAFDLDFFEGSNEPSKEWSSKDYNIYDDIENCFNRNNFFYEEALSPAFDLLKYEKSSSMFE